MKTFWLCFVPLFVAVDALGVLPLFMGLTAGLTPERRRQVVWQSLVTGIVVALSFAAIGKALFQLLGISTYDFMVAGGLLLFALSLRDLAYPHFREKASDLESMGAVPIGVPLIVGPAVLTTIILLMDAHGVVPTVLAALANILLAGVVFWFSESVGRVLGRSGSKAFSKLASLLLAAIAVMMIRKGITHFLNPG